MLNDSVDNLTLDISKSAVRASISVRQGETKSRTIHILLTNKGSVLDLENAVMAELMIAKPDGNKCDQNMVIFGNELQYTFRTQDTNVLGECICQVVVTYNDGAVVTGPEFSMYVYAKVLDQKVAASENDYSGLNQIYGKAEQAARSAEASARKSSDYATEAKNWSEASANKALEAIGAASSAAGYELSASNLASAAANSAISADNSASAAANSAASANTAASAAVNSLNNANNAANSAATYAQNASGSASQAQASANAAKTSETAAANFAGKASGYKDDALKYRNESKTYSDKAENAEYNTGLKAAAADQSAFNANEDGKKAKGFADNSQQVYETIVDKLASGEFKGEKGEKGDPGESGVMAPVSGYFTLTVDENGDLYVISSDSTAAPDFDLDSNGDLYLILPT